MTKEHDELMSMLEDIVNIVDVSSTAITKWERDFVESVQEQMLEGKILSAKQKQVIKNIWDRI